MQPEQFTNARFGTLLRQPQDYWAFVPFPLPPKLEPDWKLINALDLANRQLSQLSGLSHNLHSPHLLIMPFLRREAVLSSRIEGTQASLSDLFFFEAAGKPVGDKSDVNEVANYVRALEYGLRRLETLPISLRLMGELHQILMRDVRGGHLSPGEFRRSQNWIGNPGCTLNDATYVPPPMVEMKESLGQLENFIHAEATYPPLIRLAMIHYQFEAIHPYLDGNGRIGRLLITLLLCSWKILPQPLLYLSAFFEKNRQEYYQLLLSVSQKGEWSDWIGFFLRGVAEQSADAIDRITRLLALHRNYTHKLQSARNSSLLLRLLDQLFIGPVISVPKAAEVLQITYPPAKTNVLKLVAAGILQEIEGVGGTKLYVAAEILRTVNTDPDIQQGHKHDDSAITIHE